MTLETDSVILRIQTLEKSFEIPVRWCLSERRAVAERQKVMND